MFVISTKLDYGVALMVELARNSSASSFLALSDIANKQHISEKYLSQIIAPLKQANLVISKEGKTGGYKLARAAKQISLQNIIEALDGPVQLVRCASDDKTCPAEHKCAVQPTWLALQHDINKLLANKTLHDIL